MQNYFLKTIIILFVAGVIGLIGCDGGSSVPAPAVKAAPTDLVVIGNSLTKYGPVPSIDWYGSWGMAASAGDKDFAHLVASSMHLPLTSATSFSALELTPAASAADIPAMAMPVKSTTMVVIQLGDNVQLSVVPDFAPQYGKLLDAVNKARMLICTSTWWKDDTKDAVIKTACTEHGGRYVFIGDIRTDPANLDGLGVPFSNADVNAHPHDWGMARIAERIVSAALMN